MKQVSVILSLVCAFLMVAVACEKPAGEAEKKGKAEEAETKGAMTGAETAIMAPSGSLGRMENDEGVGHYQQEHWDIAQVHFRKSLEADPKLAEAHFNLALALDKLGKHKEATQHFKQALDLAADNPKIAKSKILQAHVGM